MCSNHPAPKRRVWAGKGAGRRRPGNGDQDQGAGLALGRDGPPGAAVARRAGHEDPPDRGPASAGAPQTLSS